MAMIWFLPDGISTAERRLVDEKSVEWCKENLGLAPTDWRGPLDKPFVINKEKRTGISEVAEASHVVIGIKEDVAGWKTGIYYAPTIRINEVKKLLKRN